MSAWYFKNICQITNIPSSAVQNKSPTRPPPLATRSSGENQPGGISSTLLRRRRRNKPAEICSINSRRQDTATDILPLLSSDTFLSLSVPSYRTERDRSSPLISIINLFSTRPAGKTIFCKRRCLRPGGGG